jgi:branched-chain amino acid transport system permease protein
MFTPIVLTQIAVNGAGLSAIYILVALGFTLLFGIMRVVNFAHGAFAMLGGYAFGVFNMPYVVAIIAAPLFVATASLVIEWSVYRFFYGRMFQSMIGLLGLDLAIVYLAVIVWDAHERAIPPAVTAIYEIGGVIIALDKIVIIGVAFSALVAFYLFLNKTRYGLAMRATAMDVDIAAAQGVDTRRIYQLAFFIAIFMAALAGGFFAQTYALSPFMGERPLMMAFVAVILGGMGSIPGTLATNGLHAGAFFRSDARLDRPDFQINFLPYSISQPSTAGIVIDRFPGFSMGLVHLNPESRGSVTIGSPDPAAAPRIHFDFLRSEADLDAMRRGMRFVRRIGAQPSFQPYAPHEITPGAAVAGDEALEKDLRERAQSNFHPAGSCAMGREGRAAVDPSGCVFGVAALRVADASIMPRVVSGNTNAPVIMIAEKIADLVKAAAG